jgi:hypothetical protein
MSDNRKMETFMNGTGQFIGLALVGRAVWKAMLGPRSDVLAPGFTVKPGGES